MSSTATPTTPIAASRPFGDLRRDDVQYAGGKGANLGELTAAGLPVPPGFVVGAPAYAAFVEETGLRARLASLLDDGAPLYMGRFPKDGRRFLRRHRRDLADRPVAVFALGPVKDTDEQWKSAREQLDRALGKLPWLRPIAIQLFGGVIDPAKLRFPFKKMGAGDVRDWERIRAWARDLADPIRAG